MSILINPEIVEIRNGDDVKYIIKRNPPKVDPDVQGAAIVTLAVRDFFKAIGENTSKFVEKLFTKSLVQEEQVSLINPEDCI